jgi:beta-galactosidase
MSIILKQWLVLSLTIVFFKSIFKMKRHILFSIFFITALVLSGHAQGNRQTISFNIGWQFCNEEDFPSSQNNWPTENGFSFTDWQTVNLPHTAKVEPLVIITPWVGISWYKKDFTPKPEWKNKKVFIEFGAAMQQAEVWLNGKHLLTHFGGYLPFTIDISNDIVFGKFNRLLVKTDNQDNPDIPPGKPIKDLDFCYYSGIYRNVSVIITNPLHITDAIYENKAASGGVRVWYPEISSSSAKVTVSTHIKNETGKPKDFYLVSKIIDKSGRTIVSTTSEKNRIGAKSDKSILQDFLITNPSLWHPDHPDLYTLQVSIKENNVIVDEIKTRIGIRKFELKDDKLTINGKRLLIVGTNRHQEYPYIGNALSDNAQYRDAVKIKEAGFNIVRLSHYPQSPAFMDACDELGILTIAAIPGWQFVGKDTFMLRSYQDARELIRRDRNHACVAFWELSLNESEMPDHFMQKMVSIAKEESPESKPITCGWINKYYDVFIPARQHANLPDYWKKYNSATPLFTGEYGDWEYFAKDAGLNQAGYAGLKSDERTSRQLRGDGEKRLLQQALNYQEAHNDNLRNPHLGDANWLMFDYNRGYSPDIESSGIMDIFRLPKFAYYFYRSQCKPTLKIASYWNEKSDFNHIKVFSNCDEVVLYLNSTLIARQKAARDEISDKLPRPPFIFDVQRFELGTLKAVGYIGNKVLLEDVVAIEGKATSIKLTYDISSKPLKADGADVIFVYATICDDNGNQVFSSNESVQFSVKGNGKLIGQNPIPAEAGIATILLQAATVPGDIKIEAKAEGLVATGIKLTTIK